VFIINRLKKLLPYILICAAGILIAGGSFYFIKLKYVTDIDTKPLTVLSKAVGVHEEIQYGDLKTIKVPASQDITMYANDYKEVVGKIALRSLPADQPILKDSISKKQELGNKEYVTIKVDYARTGGAKPGDKVDVYRVMNDGTDMWVPAAEAALILTDATVVEITNKEGSVNAGSTAMGVPLSGGASKAEVVKLCINPGQAAKVVVGSVNENSGLVLVVKSR